jgi:hypothetical protein
MAKTVGRGKSEMQSERYPQEAVKFEIAAYKKPKDIRSLKETHVAFSGSPKKHPYNPAMVILVADPFSTNNHYYEFKKDDISYAEELPNLVNPDGDTITMVRVWVKKMSVGIRCAPFIVEDLRTPAIG